MGGKFGELAKLRGLVYFKISHYEQNVFRGIFKEGIPRWIRRVREEFFYVVPPFVGGYLVYDWGEKEHARLQRKNPADYANDV